MPSQWTACNLLWARSFLQEKKSYFDLVSYVCIFVKHGHPQNHKLLANPPKAGSYFSSSSLPNPVFLERGTREEARDGLEGDNSTETNATGSRVGVLPCTPPHTPIGTLQVMSLSFLPMKMQGQNQLLSTQKGSIPGTICQMI